MQVFTLTTLATILAAGSMHAEAIVYDYTGYTVSVSSSDWSVDAATSYDSVALSYFNLPSYTQVTDTITNTSTTTTTGPTITGDYENSALEFANPGVSLSSVNTGSASQNTAITISVQAKPGWTLLGASWNGDSGLTSTYSGTNSSASATVTGNQQWNVSGSGANAPYSDTSQSTNGSSPHLIQGSYQSYAGVSTASWPHDSATESWSTDPVSGDPLYTYTVTPVIAPGFDAATYSESLSYTVSSQGPNAFAAIDSYGGEGAFDVQATDVVPEPDTYALLLLGAGLVGASARRARYKALGQVGRGTVEYS